MNKIAIALALFPASLIQAQQPATPNWVTVASFSLLHKTEPTTGVVAIYAPTEPGLYRISYYVEAVAISSMIPPQTFDNICSKMFYTDDSGTPQARPVVSEGICATAYFDGVNVSFLGAEDMFVFRSKAMPITIAVSDFYSTTYNVTGTIERLTTSTTTESH